MPRRRLPLFPRPVRWLAVVAVAAAILYVSLADPPARPAALGPLTDDVVHVAAYAGLALVSAYATANRRDRPYRRIAVVVGIAVGYGALVELLQAPLARRHYSHADLLANAVGASLVSLWFVAERRVQYVHRPLIGDEA